MRLQFQARKNEHETRHTLEHTVWEIMGKYYSNTTTKYAVVFLISLMHLILSPHSGNWDSMAYEYILYDTSFLILYLATSTNVWQPHASLA